MTPTTHHTTIPAGSATLSRSAVATTDSPLYQQFFLSIIIPAYNEEQRIESSLRQIKHYFTNQTYTTEIIVVDDGSSDQTTAIVEAFMTEYPALRLIRAPHGGKGHACKQGIRASRGQWLFLCDSDLSMPIEEVAKFIPLLHDEAAIVIASREIPGAQRFGEPSYRHLMGRVFNWLVRILAVNGIQDTQCGFKCFRANVAQDIFSVQTINGWGFDVEILFVAQQRGYSIIEVPIHWHYRSQSKINPLRDTVNMFREVWQVRLNDWRGLYTQQHPSCDVVESQ